MFQTNKKLADMFLEMSAIYRFKGAEHRFRVGAYEKAARVIEHLPEDIKNYMTDDELEDIPGVGESIAEKIREYIKSGKIKKYESLKKEIPPDFIQLLEVKGLGPQTLKTIRDKLGVTTREELVKALKDGSVEALEGFKEKSVQNMLEGLKEQERAGERILLPEALDISDWLVEKISAQPGLQKIEVAGSIRRGKETIGDIDILVSAEPKHHADIVEFFTTMPGVRKIIAEGETKASIVIDQAHRQVDMRIIEEDQWGAALLYFTGSKEHNVHLRTIAKDDGLKVNEYGLFELEGDKKIAGKTEEEMYDKMGMQWVPPEMRENNGEIELALDNKIPELIKQKDIKGDFHVHSKWSDGMNSIEDLANFVNDEIGYSYFVLTDHSKTSRIAGGLDEDEFRDQFKKIDEVNKELGKDLIKKGVEVDILPDGSLDFDDEFLAQMDWVVASVHSGLSNDNTDRILAACENPYVNAIGHPSGRLIGKRKAYPLDIEKVINMAKKTGTALEMNAQPQRMDINDEWAKMAREAEVMLVIGTDTHDVGSFTFMRQGISIARRAWCLKEDVLNTQSWDEVQEFVKAKRKRAKQKALQ